MAQGGFSMGFGIDGLRWAGLDPTSRRASNHSAISAAWPGPKMPEVGRVRSMVAIALSMGPIQRMGRGRARSRPSLLGQRRPCAAGRWVTAQT